MMPDFLILSSARPHPARGEQSLHTRDTKAYMVQAGMAIVFMTRRGENKELAGWVNGQKALQQRALV